jgi:hypothetical protein|tara:strand:- start:276 stop:458 length:183 start_codon:yes stop_codon:yes gene_type:complete
MKPYDVTIRAYAAKTIRVYAESEIEAIVDAHGKFPMDWEQYDDGEMETLEVTQPETIKGE